MSAYFIDDALELRDAMSCSSSDSELILKYFLPKYKIVKDIALQTIIVSQMNAGYFLCLGVSSAG